MIEKKKRLEWILLVYVPTPWQSLLLGQEADRLAKQVSSWP